MIFSRLAPAAAERLFAQGTLELARALLGYALVHESPEGLCAGRIVEVEAYLGPHDRAAHSFGHRRTRRTEVMYGPPGRAYIFRIYGYHHCFNVVSGPAGCPQAILVRGLQPLANLPLMAERRRLTLPASWPAQSPPVAVRQLSNGPARLCQALAIDMRCYGWDLRTSPLYLSPLAPPPSGSIGAGPRINVDYAGADAALPWRFWLVDNPWVSVRRPPVERY